MIAATGVPHVQPSIDRYSCSAPPGYGLTQHVGQQPALPTPCRPGRRRPVRKHDTVRTARLARGRGCRRRPRELLSKCLRSSGYMSPSIPGVDVRCPIGRSPRPRDERADPTIPNSNRRVVLLHPPGDDDAREHSSARSSRSRSALQHPPQSAVTPRRADRERAPRKPRRSRPFLCAVHSTPERCCLSPLGALSTERALASLRFSHHRAVIETSVPINVEAAWRSMAPVVAAPRASRDAGEHCDEEASTGGQPREQPDDRSDHPSTITNQGRAPLVGSPTFRSGSPVPRCNRSITSGRPHHRRTQSARVRPPARPTRDRPPRTSSRSPSCHRDP